MMRRAVVVGALAVGLAVIFLAVVMTMAPADLGTLGQETEPRMVAFDGGPSSFWPYLSPTPSFRSHSPVNLVVLDATVDDVVQMMGQVGWNRTINETADADRDRFALGTSERQRTNTTWGEAEGAARYAYVHDGRHGHWKRQDAQLHHGAYFTQRLHMRLYGSPVAGEWVAIQVHSEHFDWFTLRHGVDGVERARQHVEVDFMDEPFVDNVYRIFVANRGPSDADGWATVVELASLPALALVGATSMRRFARRHLTDEDRLRLRSVVERLTWDHLFLAASIVALVLGVRLGGLVLENAAAQLPPRVIAGSLFPLLALGVPLAAYGFGHRLEHRVDAAVVAGASLAMASLLDYAFLGVDELPLSLLAHRAGLVAALGLVAAGAARRATRQSRLNGLVVVGGLLWVLLVTATLMGWA